MQGILHKTEDGWVVDFPNTFNNGQLPLHPEDCEYFNTDGDSQSCSVEFEIFENRGELFGNGNRVYRHYAKLLK